MFLQQVCRIRSEMNTWIGIIVLLSFLGLSISTPSHSDPYIRTCPIGGKDIENGEEWADQQHCVKYKCQVRGPDAALLIIRCPKLPPYPRDKCSEVPGKGDFPNCCPTWKCN